MVTTLQKQIFLLAVLLMSAPLARAADALSAPVDECGPQQTLTCIEEAFASSHGNLKSLELAFYDAFSPVFYGEPIERSVFQKNLNSLTTLVAKEKKYLSPAQQDAFTAYIEHWQTADHPAITNNQSSWKKRAATAALIVALVALIAAGTHKKMRGTWLPRKKITAGRPLRARSDSNPNVLFDDPDAMRGGAEVLAAVANANPQTAATFAAVGVGDYNQHTAPPGAGWGIGGGHAGRRNSSRHQELRAPATPSEEAAQLQAALAASVQGLGFAGSDDEIDRSREPQIPAFITQNPLWRQFALVGGAHQEANIESAIAMRLSGGASSTQPLIHRKEILIKEFSQTQQQALKHLTTQYRTPVTYEDTMFKFVANGKKRNVPQSDHLANEFYIAARALSATLNTFGRANLLAHEQHETLDALQSLKSDLEELTKLVEFAQVPDSELRRANINDAILSIDERIRQQKERLTSQPQPSVSLGELARSIENAEQSLATIQGIILSLSPAS